MMNTYTHVCIYICMHGVRGYATEHSKISYILSHASAPLQLVQPPFCACVCVHICTIKVMNIHTTSPQRNLCTHPQNKQHKLIHRKISAKLHPSRRAQLVYTSTEQAAQSSSANQQHQNHEKVHINLILRYTEWVIWVGISPSAIFSIYVTRNAFEFPVGRVMAFLSADEVLYVSRVVNWVVRI
jgi:hypothetical protein